VAIERDGKSFLASDSSTFQTGDTLHLAVLSSAGDKIARNILIIGGGKVGKHLAKLLLAKQQRVKVIEESNEIQEVLVRELPRDCLIYGNGTDPSLLESLDVHHIDVVAAVTGEDETNLVACGLAKYEFHTPRTVARINNPKNAWLFTSDMGVDVAFNQADVMAQLILDKS
jgi:trk system potassium uptake protein